MGLPLIADHLLHLEQRIFLAMPRLEVELLYPSYITRYLRKVPYNHFCRTKTTEICEAKNDAEEIP